MSRRGTTAAWDGPHALAVYRFLLEMGFAHHSTSGGCCVFTRQPLAAEDPAELVALHRPPGGRVPLDELNVNVVRRARSRRLLPSDWGERWTRVLREVEAMGSEQDLEAEVDRLCGS